MGQIEHLAPDKQDDGREVAHLGEKPGRRERPVVNADRVSGGLEEQPPPRHFYLSSKVGCAWILRNSSTPF